MIARGDTRHQIIDHPVFVAMGAVIPICPEPDVAFGQDDDDPWQLPVANRLIQSRSNPRLIKTAGIVPAAVQKDDQGEPQVLSGVDTGNWVKCHVADDTNVSLATQLLP